MTFAGKAYFDAVSKIGENAAVSPVSRELGEYYSLNRRPEVLVWPSPKCMCSVRRMAQHFLVDDSLHSTCLWISIASHFLILSKDCSIFAYALSHRQVWFLLTFCDSASVWLILSGNNDKASLWFINWHLFHSNLTYLQVGIFFLCKLQRWMDLPSR